MLNSFDVYAVGNGFVDFQFAVTKELITALSAIVGGNYLFDEVSEKRLEKLVAHLPQSKSCGGAGANTLAMISKLGGKTFYTCKVGKDQEGDFYHQDLLGHGIASNLDLHPARHGATGKCSILVTPDSDRTMFTYLGANRELTEKDLHEAALANAKYLFLEAFLLVSAVSRSAIKTAYEFALRKNIPISLSLSTLITTPSLKAEFLGICHAGLDILFCNEREAKNFTNQEDLDLALLELREIAKTVIITQGELGSLVQDHQQLYKIPAQICEPVDTTGAGDAFAGAFLFALIQGQTAEQAAHVASKTTTEIISKYGARPARHCKKHS